MNMDVGISIIECIATIISLIIAVVALIQSYSQTKISNKQNLFNERIRSYLLINGLMQLYRENKRIIEEDKKEGIYFLSDFLLGVLVNNSYLEIMAKVIGKPLHQSEQGEFLKKIEELKNDSEKTRFIFNGDIAEYLYDFIIAYEEVLMELYKYSVLIDSMRKIQEQIPNKDDINGIAKEVNEIEYRERLFYKFKRLTKAFNDIETKKIVTKMEKQIKL